MNSKVFHCSSMVSWVPRRLGAPVALAALLLTVATVACGQGWQFDFDASGNLVVQADETIAPPQIVGQPQIQVVGPGELASFFVVVANSRALAYQWRFNGVPLSGAATTNDALLLLNVSASNEGLYS